MIFFQQSSPKKLLGPILREARVSRSLLLSEVALQLHLSLEEMEALEEDRPTDSRLARLHAVSYARLLGIDLLEIRDSLPARPALFPKHRQYMKNMTRKATPARHLPIEFLAPLGRVALYLVLTGILLGTWGVVRQLSRVRDVPWITSSYTLHGSSSR
jgi:cytoskeletal protein RodZ